LIHLEPKHLKLVKKILQENLPNHEIWAFGSRVHGKNLKTFSDLDLVIAKPATTMQQVMQISESFSESDLPFKVDVMDWNDSNESFQHIIKKHYEVIQ